MEMEFGVIEKMGFCGYFLIVWDFVVYVKFNGIVVGLGCGLVVGLLVVYCLEIMDFDLFCYDLLFECFLNVECVLMLDIDIDFFVRGCECVICYVIEKYGVDWVV